MQADPPAMVQLHLRLPKKLHKRLMQRAKRNNTSLNTEIINQLEQALTAATDDRISLRREDIGEIVRATVDTYREPATLSELGRRWEGGQSAGVPLSEIGRGLQELLRRWAKEIAPGAPDVPPDK